MNMLYLLKSLMAKYKNSISHIKIPDAKDDEGQKVLCKAVHLFKALPEQGGCIIHYE